MQGNARHHVYMHLPRTRADFRGVGCLGHVVIFGHLLYIGKSSCQSSLVSSLYSAFSPFASTASCLEALVAVVFRIKNRGKLSCI